jgi:glyoxylase-like metal-dependent hydrolase (beta-lactamase superfamily II)
MTPTSRCGDYDRRVTAWICTTCGTQFPPSDLPPTGCPICLDPRQYVGYAGQVWTTMPELARDHANRIEQVEPGLVGIGTDPSLAIGQRAVLSDGLLWDCITLIDDETERAVQALGGIHTIAISHPHYYGAMVEWAERFDARILLHEADREHIVRPSPRIELWSGERLPLGDGRELIRLGGHFAGGTVCRLAAGADGRGALLTGDIVQVVADRGWVSFMYSYPNLIPLPAREVARIRGVLETLAFDRVYGAWWPAIVVEDAKRKALRSADRYLDAIGGT